MKNIILSILMVAGLLSSCKEDSLVGDFTYQGPVPSITEASSGTAKLCYEIYKKYDFHIYANLSGDDAMISPLGEVSKNLFIAGNSKSYPVQLPDEAKAIEFLTVLQQVYALFPDDVLKKNLFKRQVLVKVNPSANGVKSTDDYLYYNNSLMDEGRGVVFYGDLDATVHVHKKDFRESVIRVLLYGLIERTAKGFIPPAAFTNVSKGYYKGEGNDSENTYLCFDTKGRYKVETGYMYGFVEPAGAKCSNAGWNNADLASFASWIILVPQIQREQIMSFYPKVMQKYTVALEFFATTFGLDLEKISETYLQLK